MAADNEYPTVAEIRGELVMIAAGLLAGNCLGPDFIRTAADPEAWIATHAGHIWEELGCRSMHISRLKGPR